MYNMVKGHPPWFDTSLVATPSPGDLRLTPWLPEGHPHREHLLRELPPTPHSHRDVRFILRDPNPVAIVLDLLTELLRESSQFSGQVESCLVRSCL